MQLFWCCTLLAMAWLPSVHTALCSFTNTHPNSNGAYLTLYSNYELTTSPTAAYAETVYFDCGGMHNIALQTYHATGQQIFLGQGHHSWYSLSHLSCQAVNMFTIEPLSYGDDRYQLDLNAGWSVVPEGAVRVILLNTGFDGLIYWEHRQAISEDWQGQCPDSNSHCYCRSTLTAAAILPSLLLPFYPHCCCHSTPTAAAILPSLLLAPCHDLAAWHV